MRGLVFKHQLIRLYIQKRLFKQQRGNKDDSNIFDSMSGQIVGEVVQRTMINIFGIGKGSMISNYTIECTQ